MTQAPLLAFTAAGSPQQLSQVIERDAQQHGSLQALVVPWESRPQALSMAVTSVKADGWAIEHTNLGTITLTDLGRARTRVELVAHPVDHPEQARLAELLAAFGRQMQRRFEVQPDQDHGVGE